MACARLGTLPRLAAATVVGVVLLASPAAAGRLKRPIDPAQQTSLAFGERSHWLQPWRGYLDTVPAVRLRDAIGINFNVRPGEARPTARLLARSGFRRARTEFGWDTIDYDAPSRLAQPRRLHTVLRALKDNGIRPLILLNANHGVPGPARFFDAVLTRPARRGDRHVRLDPATARMVVPGRSGLNRERPRRAADVIFTRVDAAGSATLSRPLDRDLSAGPHPAATLRFAPFGPPRLEDGRRNPAFEQTLGGWLAYVGAVTREAKAALGGEDFDVEIWNELSFGSDFLYQKRYYDPPRERGQGDVTQEILARTVASLRDPRNGVSGIGIGNGFSNQRPWESGATSPPGLTANDEHPYYGIRRFPADTVMNGLSPLDALGRPDFAEAKAPGGRSIRRDRFVPRYDSFFPEYILSAIQTEHMVRDLSPMTTSLYRKPHGRNTRPPGAPAPTVWITETNLDPTGTGLTGADVQHLQAKAALRYFTAFVNKGVSALHLYAVKGRNLALVDPADDEGGETPRAVRRLVGALEGAQPLAKVRPLSLLGVSDRHDHRQFEGDGTAAHPPLYDRDVLAFLPFQVRPGRYVVPVYVMTRSLATLYRPGAPASDRSRYDLPPERFRLTIGGLRSTRVVAGATDPLTGAAVPVRVLSRRRGRLVVDLPVTDSPRLLTLDERPRRIALSLRAKRRRLRRGRAQLLEGRLRHEPACTASLRVAVKRWSPRRRRWRTLRAPAAKAASTGSFSVSLPRLRAGRYRARAVSRSTCGTARSRTVSFRVR